MKKTKTIKATEERTPASGLLSGVSEKELFEESQFMTDVDIELDNLNANIVRHPSLYYKYGKLHRISLRMLRDAEMSVEVAKRESDRVYAVRAGEIRSSTEDLTEKKLEQLVKTDKVYLRSQDAYAAARQHALGLQYDVSILELAEKVFSKRTDLLTVLGYSLRAEQRSDFDVREGTARDGMEDELSRQKDSMRRTIRDGKQRGRG